MEEKELNEAAKKLEETVKIWANDGKITEDEKDEYLKRFYELVNYKIK
jgi:type II secretory pathway predicted ATPase ExeA